MKENEETKILKFLYHTVPGRVVLKILTAPLLSKIAGAYMDLGVSKIHIKSFIKNAGIDLSEYEPEKYRCFNDCFTRKIKPENRPVCVDAERIVAPCDGKLSAYRISEDSDFYIKKSHYRIQDLLKDSKKAPDYNGGICLIFRLCVDNYHRYGYVDDGIIVENKYIPGKLHTVRPIAVNRYPVFIQNSREYTVIKTKNFGTVSQIEIGAMMIGKIKNHQTSGAVVKGAEKGMFLYGGSTIAVLLEKDAAKIAEKYFENTENDIETGVKYGQALDV